MPEAVIVNVVVVPLTTTVFPVIEPIPTGTTKRTDVDASAVPPALTVMVWVPPSVALTAPMETPAALVGGGCKKVAAPFEARVTTASGTGLPYTS